MWHGLWDHTPWDRAKYSNVWRDQQLDPAYFLGSLLVKICDAFGIMDSKFWCEKWDHRGKIYLVATLPYGIPRASNSIFFVCLFVCFSFLFFFF